MFVHRLRGALRPLAIAASLVGLLCGSAAWAQEVPPPLGKSNIVFTYGGWGTGRAITELGKLLLEKIGYTVELRMLDTGVAYQTIAVGKADLWSGAWLPGQQEYFNKLGDKLDILSMSYGPVPGGLMVPAYMPVSSIEDLKKPEIKAQLKGTIVGASAGTGVVMLADKANKEYGLNYQVVTSSDATMASAFKAAYDKKEPVVITGWCPHYLCGLYSVKFLEDPKGIFGDGRDFHVVRKGFRQDFPRATVLLSRYTLFSEQMSKMLVWMEMDKLTAEQAAQRFVEQNPDLVWYWIGDLTQMQKPAMLMPKT